MRNRLEKQVSEKRRVRRQERSEGMKALALKYINEVFDENASMSKVIEELRIEVEYLKKELKLYIAEKNDRFSGRRVFPMTASQIIEEVQHSNDGKE